jgi:hypothetical protein
MYNYDTVTEALADLKARGFTYDFNLGQDGIHCAELNRSFAVPELTVMESYRFEGATDPGDEAVVYAIAANDGVSGTFINGYGASADAEKEELLHLLLHR